MIIRLKTRAFALLLIFTLLLTIFPGAMVWGEANHPMPLNNKNFEDGNLQARPPGWNLSNDSIANASQSVVLGTITTGKQLHVSDPSSTLDSAAESDKMPVTTGYSYTLGALVFLESGSMEMQLRFYDGGNVLISQENKSVDGPAATWVQANLAATAPANAVKVAVAFYSGKANIGSFYVDNVSFDREPLVLPTYMTNLGDQINNVTMLFGGFGKTPDNREMIYTVLTADPSILVIMDLKTREIIKQVELPGTSGAWGVIQAKDKRFYIGAYNTAYLYQYDMSTDTLVNLGMPITTNTSVLYNLVEDNNGKIYGGSYFTGAVWEYDPATNKFANLGQTKSGSQYTRGMGYDPATNKLYAGSGTNASVIEIDLNNPDYKNPASTTARKDLLPAIYGSTGAKKISYIYDLNVVGNTLFAKKDPQTEMLAFNLGTGQPISALNKDTGTMSLDIPLSSRGVSPKSPVGNKVYFTYGGYLCEYDLTTNSFEKVKDPEEPSGYFFIGYNAIGFGYTQLSDPDFPGYSLVAMVGSAGRLYTYNPQTGKKKVELLPFPEQPVLINSIYNGPDGKIYSGGYLAGGLSAYDPVSHSLNEDIALSQPEGMASLGGKLYLGLYPRARVFALDPKLPWGTPAQVPVEKFRLETYKQDRPYAMLGVEEFNKLYVGTIPSSGNVGGAFAVYQPDTGQRTTYYGPNSIAPDQAVMSLAYKGGKLFIGTSISGGLNTTPKTTQGHVIVWDVATDTMIKDNVLPVAGKTAINNMVIGPDGNVWGMANGTLFVLNPDTYETMETYNLFPKADNPKRDGTLEFGNDGNLYGVISGNFFKFDVTAKLMTIIQDKGVFDLAQDNYGSMYTRVGSELLKYSHPDLVLPLAELKVNGKDIEDFKPNQMDYTVKVPYGAIPEVTAAAMNSKANVQINQAASIPGTTAITVTDEGVSRSYNVHFEGIDITPPSTTSDAPTGWQNKDVTVTLTAADDASGVMNTFYILDDGVQQMGNLVTITAEGKHTLSYWSVDKAGNKEERHTVSIYIDKTAPVVKVTMDKDALWPANNKLVTVNAAVYADDILSGIDSIILTSITDGGGETSSNVTDKKDLELNITDAQYGTPDTSFMLRAAKLDEGKERVYTVTYVVTDKAGNQTSASAAVTVPHDRSNKE